MRILCVHQGYELYGSDRSFLFNVLMLREELTPSELSVVLPRQGELSEAFAGHGISVSFADLWVPRRALGLGWLARRLLALPLAVRRAARRARAHDLVYVNTSVVFDHILAARVTATPTILHVREIPIGRSRPIVRALVLLSGASVIFNSSATKAAFSPAPEGRVWTVLPNAVPDPFETGPPDLPSGTRFHLLMVGRINAWKGQDFLLEAIACLPPELRDRIALRMIGSGFEEDQRMAELKKTARNVLGDHAELRDFEADPFDSFAWANAVVVPSRRPEPFGLVAIEAMAAGRAVIAADHGGLSEIVEDRVTGRRFAPNNTAAFCEALIDTMQNSVAMGAAGRTRYLAEYSTVRYRAGLRQTLQTCLGEPMHETVLSGSQHASSRP